MPTDNPFDSATVAFLDFRNRLLTIPSRLIVPSYPEWSGPTIVPTTVTAPTITTGPPETSQAITVTSPAGWEHVVRYDDDYGYPTAPVQAPTYQPTASAPILSVEELRELLRMMDQRPLDDVLVPPPGWIEAAPLATGRRKIRV